MALELSVIAPCFNEEENIDPLVDRTLATFDRLAIPAELLVVDDGSSDATWKQISQRAKDDSRVVGVRHPVNLGIEGAWQSALKQARGELVCLIDADLQNRPEDIARLYEAYRRNETADLIQGVRDPGEGMRRLLLYSRTLNFALNASFGMKRRDNKSGFILCRREVMSDILTHRYRYRYFQSFIGVSAGARGYRTLEVETVFDRRTAGQSFLAYFPASVALRILWELLKFRIESLGVSAGVPKRASAGAARAASPPSES